MSLPWFAFHIDKFLSDTLALDGPAGGAYMFLMLHYYATEKPPRDNDRTLATIARLPIDVWIERRPEIEAFFQIRDGAWHHPTIEAEIAEAKRKHSSAVERGSSGGKSRWANTKPKPPQTKDRPLPKPSSELSASISSALSNTPAIAELLPEQKLKDTHLTITESLSVSVLTVDKDNSGDNSESQSGDDEAGDQEETLGTPIDPTFWPCENHIAACRFDGADDLTIRMELQAFIAWHQEHGTFSSNWDASWTKWWIRWKQRRAEQAAKEAKKARPRVEVSNVIDWDAHAKRWAGGMGWPRGIGSDPSSPACRCPPDVLERHGIDPRTGEKIKTTEKV